MQRNLKESGFHAPSTESTETDHPNVNDKSLGKRLDDYNDYDYTSTSASTVGKRIAREIGLAAYTIDGLCDWTRGGDVIDYKPQKSSDGKIRRYLFKDRDSFLVFLALEDTLMIMSRESIMGPTPQALVERTRARLGEDPLNDPTKLRNAPTTQQNQEAEVEETQEEKRKREFITWRKGINKKLEGMTQWNSLQLGILLDDVRIDGVFDSVPAELRQVLIYLLRCNEKRPFSFDSLGATLRVEEIPSAILLARGYMERFPKIASLPQLVHAFEKKLGIDGTIKE